MKKETKEKNTRRFRNIEKWNNLKLSKRKTDNNPKSKRIRIKQNYYKIEKISLLSGKNNYFWEVENNISSDNISRYNGKYSKIY